jgi:hypothetical protein
MSWATKSFTPPWEPGSSSERKDKTKAATGAPPGVSDGATGYFIFDNTDPSGGTLYWDSSGGSGADAVAIVKLQGVNALLSSDFHLV